MAKDKILDQINRRMALSEVNVSQIPRVLMGFQGTEEDLKEFFLLLEGFRTIEEMLATMIQSANSINWTGCCPDGQVGGKGYIVEVGDFQTALSQMRELAYRMKNAFHDECYNNPYWEPVKDKFQKFQGEAEEELDDAQDEAAEEGQEDAKRGGEQGQRKSKKNLDEMEVQFQDDVKEVEFQFTTPPLSTQAGQLYDNWPKVSHPLSPETPYALTMEEIEAWGYEQGLGRRAIGAAVAELMDRGKLEFNRSDSTLKPSYDE